MLLFSQKCTRNANGNRASYKAAGMEAGNAADLSNSQSGGEGEESESDGKMDDWNRQLVSPHFQEQDEATQLSLTRPALRAPR